MGKISSPDEENKGSPKSFAVRAALFSVEICGAVFVCSYVGVGVHSFWTDKEWIELAKEHASAAVGLPVAAVAAFLLVSILQVTAGKIEFEGLGFKFRGASGPVVLWIACFIAMAICINLLWS